MTLDLTRMASQIEAMAGHLSRSTAEGRQRLARAQSRYNQEKQGLGTLRAKLQACQGKVTWMPAGLAEDWNDTYPLPQLPADFTVLASDGSQIELERHAAASCYLINIGLVSLRYGRQPDAYLSSQATLFYRPEDLVVANPANANQWMAAGGKLLKLRRSIMEAQALGALAAVGAIHESPLPTLLESAPSATHESPVITPTLALMDGTLILWDLAAKEVDTFVRELFLGPFLDALEALRQMPALALASYISDPRATDVVDTLRIAECPYEPPNCDRHCRQLPAGQGRPCDRVAEGLRDADLFRERLGPGERSPLFRSQSRVLDYYGDHRVYFFYVSSGDEIARVEVPQWVATDPKRLDTTHSLVLDQTRRGQGYPAALTEAHEQAVVRAADRDAFWSLVEAVLADGKLPAATTSKAQSKRTRGL